MEHLDNSTFKPVESNEHTSTLGYRRPPVAKKISDPDEGLLKKKGAQWEPRLSLPSPLTHLPSEDLLNPCDPENPRVFHMFWTGPFTDKPYLALLSFLFTQNTGMRLQEWSESVDPNSGYGSTKVQLLMSQTLVLCLIYSSSSNRILGRRRSSIRDSEMSFNSKYENNLMGFRRLKMNGGICKKEIGRASCRERV